MHVFTWWRSGVLLSFSVLTQGVWEALGGSVFAQSVVLLIPGLLDREDELLALQCGTAPHFS